jgi:hypothetical protein
MNWNFVPLIAINQWQQLFSNRSIIRSARVMMAFY